MSRIRLSLVLVGFVLVAGCGSAATAAPPVPTTTAVAPGVVALTGDLKAPKQLDAAALAALPQKTVDVSFQSSKGAEKHTETGVPLASVLPADALATTSKKNDQLSFAVLAVGSDGYSAVFAYGDVSPDFGNRGLLVSLTEDGKALARPRLVVPGDVKGGRYVSDLVALKVVRLGS